MKKHVFQQNEVNGRFIKTKTKNNYAYNAIKIYCNEVVLTIKTSET